MAAKVWHQTLSRHSLIRFILFRPGITNHDEYSLVRENTEKDKENVNNSTYSSGTLTLKKNKDRDRPLDNKMEQLKKKLKTDDDLNWVDLSKTLREQGIEDDETLLLRRKFFYSDQNIDSRDPVQLSKSIKSTGLNPLTLTKLSPVSQQIYSMSKPGTLSFKALIRSPLTRPVSLPAFSVRFSSVILTNPSTSQAIWI